MCFKDTGKFKEKRLSQNKQREAGIKNEEGCEGELGGDPDGTVCVTEATSR